MDGEIRGSRIVTRPTGSLPVSSRYQPPLELRRERRCSFPGEARQSTPISTLSRKTGPFLTCSGKQRTSRVRTGISGNFWSFVKCVEDPFEFQGNRGLSLETLQRKRASSSVQGRISWFAWICGEKLTVPLELHVDLGDPLMSS